MSCDIHPLIGFGFPRMSYLCQHYPDYRNFHCHICNRIESKTLPVHQILELVFVFHILHRVVTLHLQILLQQLVYLQNMLNVFQVKSNLASHFRLQRHLTALKFCFFTGFCIVCVQFKKINKNKTTLYKGIQHWSTEIFPSAAVIYRCIFFLLRHF